MSISSINQKRLLNAKIAYPSRNLNLESITTLLHGNDVIPNAGDMLLAKVTQTGRRSAIELANGRRSALFVGDEIIVCYGNCYASERYEAQAPKNLETCDLVASGGIAARIDHRHADFEAPTTIQPIGLLADNSHRCINLKDTALPKLVSLFPRPYTVGVVGTSMNAGKTTTATMLIRGLINAGYTVGAAKITGASGRDTWSMVDAGAKLVLDFTHVGFPSTYLISPDQVDTIIEMLVTHLSVAKMDAIVIEVGDGLFQRETAALLNSRTFAKTVDGIILAAVDAMGAVAGTELLERKRLPITAISGRLTASPLAIAEAASATGLSVLDETALSSHTIVDILQIPLQTTSMQMLSASST
jgi:hypothetical protein